MKKRDILYQREFRTFSNTRLHRFPKTGMTVSAARHAEFLKFLPDVASLKSFVSNLTKAGCNHNFMQLIPMSQVGFIAATSMN
jgi:hypothetical protein